MGPLVRSFLGQTAVDGSAPGRQAAPVVTLQSPRHRFRTALAAFPLAGAVAFGASCKDGADPLALPTVVPGATGTPVTGINALKIYTVVYDSTTIAAGQTTRTIETLVQDPPRSANHTQILNEYAGQVWFIDDGTRLIACSKGIRDAGSCRATGTSTPSSPGAVASIAVSSATPSIGLEGLGLRSIAGRSASCFAYPATPAGSPTGPSEICLDAEWGVMLYMKAIADGSTSELVATSVLPTADPGAFLPPFPVVQ